MKLKLMTIILLFPTVVLLLLGCAKYDGTSSSENICTSTEENYIVEEHVVTVDIYTTEVDLLAKTVYGEARGLNALEQSAVVWCILNRVDAYNSTIVDVVTAPNQFHGYNYDYPVTDEIKALVEDVLVRWQMEKLCIGDVGRTLPKDYMWFHGDGRHNYFRNAYSGNYTTWDWSLGNPYD